MGDHPGNAVYYFSLELIFRYGRHPIGLAHAPARELLPLAVWAFFSMYSSTLGKPEHTDPAHSPRRIRPGAKPSPSFVFTTSSSTSSTSSPLQRVVNPSITIAIELPSAFNSSYTLLNPPAAIFCSAFASGANFQHVTHEYLFLGRNIIDLVWPSKTCSSHLRFLVTHSLGPRLPHASNCYLLHLATPSPQQELQQTSKQLAMPSSPSSRRQALLTLDSQSPTDLARGDLILLRDKELFWNWKVLSL